MPMPIEPLQMNVTAGAEHESATALPSPRSRILASVFHYRALIYFCTFLSGAVGLIFQIAWQRYLSFLVGSEARSISLVVAVFLLGLAAGYRFWGNITERQWSRMKILKAVGFIELGIAAYGLIFPQYFALIKLLTYSGPDWLVFDLLMTGLLLIPPTFLMGASIPLLTSAVPTEAAEVNYCHSRIYGINTLGAFVGAMVAGFYLVPVHGLRMSLVIGSVISAAVGLVYLLNRLEGTAHKAEDIPRIPNRFGPSGIYLFVFVTGAVSISLEVIFTRLVGLSIGSGYFVFPIVVGVVILGLAIGSLSLRRVGITAARVPFEITKLSVILALLYLTVPYWPYWLSHVRVSLVTMPSNYGVFLALVVLFVSAIILPVVIPMGRLLPMGYALIDKTRDDYGKLCGRVYCMNTLGTVAGAVGIGYLLFLWLDMPAIFRVNIALLLVLAALLRVRSGRRISAAVSAAAAIGAISLLPGWDRTLHCTGLFRHDTVQQYHFKGLFYMPRHDELEVLYLRDDPTMTVSAYNVTPFIQALGRKVESRSIAVNAKSDGNTIGDYSNMVLAGVIPYLYSSREHGLKTAVVGLGTGMTAGALAAGDDVDSVTVLEISPAVAEALHFFDQSNFGLSKNPKARIIQTDAFRFFARTGGKFDVIASEPSNPWVVGVENLFTPEFYQLVTKSLNDDGVFFQWIQMYENNQEILTAIVRNLVDEFQYVSMFAISAQDIGILASHAPLDRPHVQRRMAEPGMRTALAPMGIDDPALFSLMEMQQTRQLQEIGLSTTRPRHSVEFPWIGHAAGLSRFLREVVELDENKLSEYLGRGLPFTVQRRADFARWMGEHADPGRLDAWCKPAPERHSAAYICAIVQPLINEYRLVKQPTNAANCYEKLAAYGSLRDQGFIDQDLPMLEEAHTLLGAGANTMSHDQMQQVAGLLATQYAFEWEWATAAKLLQEFQERAVLTPSQIDTLRQKIAEHLARSRRWLERATAFEQ